MHNRIIAFSIGSKYSEFPNLLLVRQYQNLYVKVKRK